jgi:1,4-dihydroxy-2-naphthoate octaprenyltransferase
MTEVSQRIDQPSSALAGPGMAAAARRAFLATRPPFLIASVMPVLVGTAWANSVSHRFNGLLFGLALAATVLAHAAANVYNDVGDDLIGADAGNTDRIYPYTGGSRFIQTGLLSRGQMTHLALGLAAAALTLGALLAAASGAAIMIHALPLWYAIAALAAASLGLWAACGISIERTGRPRLKQSIELTLAIHALGCVFVIAAILTNPSI